MVSSTHAVSRGAAQPVKMVVQRRVRPGAREPFEAWIRRLLDVAAGAPAFEGSSVLTADSGEYFILLRFASQADLDGFESSAAIRELMRDGESLASAGDQPQKRTGFETWFTLPGLPAPRSAPPQWKMAVITWGALLPQVIVLAWIMPAGLPFLASVALSTAIPVAMLTWVIMPRLTRLLYGWLYANGEASDPG